MKPRRRSPGDPKRAIALLRVSTEDQRLGPEAQRAAITAWATREAIEVVVWHLEQGVSGATQIERRMILMNAIEDVAAHRAGYLVVAKRDRLARDVVVAAMIERLVERNGARVVAADGTTNADGPEGMLMRGIVDVFAAYERLVIGTRTRAALAEKRARGQRTGGVPFGSALAEDDHTLISNSTERAVISAVHEMRARGLSIRGIVAECSRAGFVSRSGRPLGKTQVERILRRRAGLVAAA